MATFGSLKSDIASEIVRTDIDDLIGVAIQTAITIHGTTPFTFNQDVQSTITTAGVGSLGLPPGYFQMVSIKILSEGVYYTLTPRSYAELERLDSTEGHTQKPVHYGIFSNLIRLYPIPNDAYTTYISYHRTYPVPTLDADTHTLIDNAEFMIKCEAKAFIFEHVLQDSARAVAFRMAAQNEKLRLTGNYGNEIIPILAD